MVAIVLAAGGGERFGTATKQLAELDGRPLVAHAVETAAAAGVDRIVVVVGHDHEAVAAAARRACPDVEVVLNPDHAEGQATSLVAGVRVAAAERAAAVVVLLADQPGIGPESVRAVAAAVRDGTPAARASYADGVGHPVAFARSSFGRLLDVQGDRGARGLLRELDVAPVLVAGEVPDDIDHLDDLRRLRGDAPG